MHTLPGRIRFHLPGWPGQGAQYIEKSLRQIPGVCRAEANPLTQNVLIGFDAHRLSQETLLGQLQSVLLHLKDTAVGEKAAGNDDLLPPVVEEWVSGPRQRARIAVRGLDRDPRLAKFIIHELEKYPQVRAEAVPLTEHILVEYEAGLTPLEELVARVAELELPPLPNEERPAHPLDPAPLAQALVRTAGAVLGLTYIAVQRLRHAEGSPRDAAKAAAVSAVIGLFRSFPLFRHGLRKVCGPNTADATLSLANIVSLTATRSPLGLTVMGIEAYVLLRQVLALRESWQRYEHHHGAAPEIRPNSVLRLKTGDRLLMRGRVLQGTGIAIHRDGLPVPIYPGLNISAGSQLVGGPFILQVKEGKTFVPSPRPTLTVPNFFNTYIRSLGPITLLYAGIAATVTRSLAQTFNALLLVNPRTALGGTEAANLDASTRAIRCGAIVVGSRPNRVIQRPHLVLLDGARIVTDGLELCRVVPLYDKRGNTEWLSLAAGVAAAAGSPWGGFAHVAHEAASEGGFDGTTATAVIDNRLYALQPIEDPNRFPKASRFHNRGEYVLQLSDAQTRQPLALIALRPKLAAGTQELIQTCKRHGVRLGIAPGGDMVALQALAHRVDIPLIASADSVGMICKSHRQGARVAFVSDSAEAAETFAACDLAIGMAASRWCFPARVDLLAPNLAAVAAIVEAGARRDAAVRDAVLLSVASNIIGAVWGFFTRPGVERALIPVYLGILSAVSDGLARMAGGRQAGAALTYLIDPHPERWGRQSIEKVLQALHSSEQGLTSEQAAKRHRKALPKAQRQEALAMQFSYPITSILAGAASLSLIVGQPFDFAIIVATIGINIAVGIWQERQTNQAAEALKQMGTATARALASFKPFSLRNWSPVTCCCLKWGTAWPPMLG